MYTAGNTRETITPPAWRQPIVSYADHLATSHTPATAEVYVRHVRRLADAFPDTAPADLTTARLSDWLARQNWSTDTRRKMITSWRSFYRHLVDTRQSRRNPIAGLPIRIQPPGPAPRAVPRLWLEPIDGYLVNLRAGGRTAGTVELYRYVLLDLANTFPNPWKVSDDDLTGWVGRVDLSPDYRKTRRSVARGFYGWAVRTGRTKANPAAGLPTVRVPRALPRPITNPALLDALHRADDRQRTIMLLAALAGLRRAEIAGLAWEDWNGDQLTIRGKGGRYRWVPVHPELTEALTAWRQRSQPSPYVFPNPKTGQPLTPPHLATLLRGALPPGWTLHQLRHRFATTAYGVQRDLRAVQELLGHAKPETTARYAAVPDGAISAAVAGVGIIDAWRSAPAGLDGHRWPCPRAQSRDTDCTDQGCRQ